MIIRKSPAEIEVMAKAGKVVAALHEVLREAVKPGVSTARLDEIAERELYRRGALASFKGYRGSSGSAGRPFPATLCTSVNDEIVHGIPSDRVVLREGDLIKIDAGAIVDGYHGDSAVTWVVGDASAEVMLLVESTRAALWDGLVAALEGGRLTDISAAVEARGNAGGYGVVQGYAGHGIGRALHEAPSVPNHGRPGRGPRLRSGLVLAIEPMFNLGAADTEVLDDDWTVVTADGQLSAHWEHTVAITPEGPRVLTARSDEPAWPLQQPAAVAAITRGDRQGAPQRVDVREAG